MYNSDSSILHVMSLEVLLTHTVFIYCCHSYLALIVLTLDSNVKFSDFENWIIMMATVEIVNNGITGWEGLNANNPSFG